MAFIKILLVISGLLAFYFILEMVQKLIYVQPKVTRKIAHIVSSGVAILLLFLLTYQEYLVAVTFFILFFAASKSRNLLKSIHLRDRVTYGEVFYPLGILLVIILAYNNKFIAISAISILGISDTLAELVGGQYAKQTKSYIGSLAFFSSALAILLFLCVVFGIHLDTRNIIKIITVAAGTTIFEAVSPYGSDNIAIPLGVIGLLYLLF